MLRIKTLLLFCFTALTTLLTANVEAVLLTDLPGHVFLQLGLYQGIQGQNNQQINIQDLIGDTFTSNHRDDISGLIGLGYFIDGPDLACMKMSYGVNAFYLDTTYASGNVIQENLFTNLSYTYRISHLPIYMMAKSVVNLPSQKYAFTFDLGLGVNFLKAYRFREQSLDGITLPDDPFTSHTTTNFSGTIGIGFRINQAFIQTPFECAYRFFYLGRGHFNTNNNQILNSLNTGNTYGNAVICGVSV